MKKDQEGYDLHILVCTNEKPRGSNCAARGGAEILEKLKSWSRSGALQGGKVRINKSGCLGRCEEGVVCVAYPKGEWVVEATPQDLPELQEWVSSLLPATK